MEKRQDQQTRTESKTKLVEQINSCLHSGDYSRALDLSRGAAAEFSDDAQFSELEKLAQGGIKRNAEANRLITESQDLFALQKSAEAIQLLREAYELDKKNPLPRAILANALVEHAHSLVETDWRHAETLAREALELNPAHPTAKTIPSLVIERKRKSSIEDWASQARALQAGDLFAALACVAEGLAVYPDDPKLLQIQDQIQRDQRSRLRQSRRRDVEDLRRMDSEIDAAADLAAKQALAQRIQMVAAKYWTDGEILFIANGLLHRLGLAPQESSTAPPHGKGATVIFHVPRPSVPKSSSADTSADTTPVPPTSVPLSTALPSPAPSENVTTAAILPSKVPPSDVLLKKVPPSIEPLKLLPTPPPEPQLLTPQVTTVPAAETSAAAAKVTSPPSLPKPSARSNSTALILTSAAALILVAAIFFFVGKHHVANTPSAAPTVSVATASVPATPASVVSTPASVPSGTAPSVSVPAQTTPESSPPAPRASPGTTAEEVRVNDQPPTEPGRNLGTLLIVAGQDDVNVFLNGQLQPRLTQAGQLRLPNLELKDYVVQVSKSGFQDPPQQTIRIRKGEQARLIFSLQPQLRLASLTIQGGAPGTTVLVDQTPLGTVQPDGTLSVATVSPGDHTIELRKERFNPRQFKKHFVVGGTISLAAVDAALESAPGELKITFAPADAKVAIAKGELLKMVSSGVPLNLPAGTYTLTARTAEKFTRASTLEVVAGQSRTLDLSLAPSGMSKWDDPGAWKQDADSFVHKGGDFVLYGVVPASGTFVFSAMLTKGHLLQWVLNYNDPKNYVLFQLDDNNFYRAVIRNGQKTDEIKLPNDKGERKSFRTLLIRVSPTELVHQIKHGDSWTVLDRWTQPGANLSLGKFGFYLPGSDQVALSSFAHYADLNTH